MLFLQKNNTIEKMNELGNQKIPFLFVISYDMENNFVEKLINIEKSNILFNFNGFCNYDKDNFQIPPSKLLNKKIISFDKYKVAYDYVQNNLHHGNSYLTNLTFPSKIKIEGNLENIFHSAKAPYKLLFDDKFVCFSPETFVKIDNGKISTYPMKGTIDASIENALDNILSDYKETAEHNTVVDLLRNDLSIVAKNVRVERFRYFEFIKSANKSLIQISSEISGDLPPDFNQSIGNLIFKMLPAGSVTGAPKERTIEIINQAEDYDRGFYTGICGIFNGEKLDSAVMIRFIETENGEYFYKSGGGITVHSNLENEYQELQDKIYVPIA